MNGLTLFSLLWFGGIIVGLIGIWLVIKDSRALSLEKNANERLAKFAFYTADWSRGFLDSPSESKLRGSSRAITIFRDPSPTYLERSNLIGVTRLWPAEVAAEFTDYQDSLSAEAESKRRKQH
jgi:hypothetical protein